jgi:hypothetical protein
MTLCSLELGNALLTSCGNIFAEDGSRMFIRNFAGHLADCTVSVTQKTSAKFCPLYDSSSKPPDEFRLNLAVAPVA